jgi:hypothetical protein
MTVNRTSCTMRCGVYGMRQRNPGRHVLHDLIPSGSPGLGPPPVLRRFRSVL